MNARLKSAEPASFALDADQAIGQIAVNLPGATAIFRRLKLDFCCGGQVSLRQAATEKGLNPAAVVAELNQLQRSQESPTFTDPTELVDHILTRYHAVHRAQLPELIRMARRVEAVHRDSPEVPHGLANLLEAMEAELLSHMEKEESILFPLLKAGGHPLVVQPIGMMRAEHVDHGAMLDELARLTHDGVPPYGACNTWRALYAGIQQLNDDLIQHIHLENNVLFTHFEAAGTGGDCSTSGCACN